eukprot:5250306-Pyramimonas_sp.AAC.1
MLYAGVVDPSLENSLAWLRCHQRCQAITMMAEVHGHGRIPYSGEDLAATMRTGRPPRDFFRPLEQGTNEGHKYLGAAMRLIAVSTCRFSDAKNKRLGPGSSPQSFMRDHLYGTDVDIKCGACGPTLLE